MPSKISNARRWSYAIDASMPATRAVATILETLLGVMVGNEQGVIERRDQESLHDYRVALRRTRSALSLFRGMLEPAMDRRGRKFFADLGRRTSTARDLDVLRLALHGYVEDPAGAAPAGMARLEQEIARETRRRYAAIRRWFESKTYGREIATWRSDLAGLAATAGSGPMAEGAARAIRKAALRVDRQIERVATDDPAVSIHRLRIRFKKLRHALEFSRSLVRADEPAGADEINGFIDALEHLQDELGSYQDLVVHQRRIGEFCGAKGSDTALESLGRRLIVSLDERRQSLRESIQADVADFGTGAQIRLECVLEAFG